MVPPKFSILRLGFLVGHKIDPRKPNFVKALGLVAVKLK